MCHLKQIDLLSLRRGSDEENKKWWKLSPSEKGEVYCALVIMEINDYPDIYGKPGQEFINRATVRYPSVGEGVYGEV